MNLIAEENLNGAFDLPGVDPSSIEVAVENHVLSVKAERRWPRQEGDQVLVSERPQGTYTRQLALGENLDADHIEARYDGGVLTVSIPVAEAAKPRKIEILVGSEPQAIEAEASSRAA